LKVKSIDTKLLELFLQLADISLAGELVTQLGESIQFLAGLIFFAGAD
jgi:hypothetical protein